jgi:hypothetical protein
VGHGLARALSWFLVVTLIAWGTLALWLDASRQAWLARMLAIAFLAGCAALLMMLHPRWRAMLAVLALGLLVLLWWLGIPPRNDRDWSPEVARLPLANITGNQITIQNVRDFDYRAENEFTERWETRNYDLKKLQGVDMFLCYWGPTIIAHTIVSWQFMDGPPLAISIETRREKGETYSALRGFFRQYELYYVVADERDVIRLRTNCRGEHVYLYHLRTRPEETQAVLLDYLQSINGLAKRPRWYNALTQNCTTTIRYHALHVGASRQWDWRILANGYIDELGYERGTLDTSLPFAELKARSAITSKARAADDTPDFSARIREGLPGMRL